MIDSIDIKNFKSLKGDFFPLKGLNVLLGVNGMGKSSFIQALLSLKQSENLKYGRLDLNSDQFINLGTSKDVLYQYSKTKDLSLAMKFKSGFSFDFDFKYEPEADYLIVKSEIVESEKINSFQTSLIKEALFSDNFQYLNANRIEPTSINRKSFSNVVRKSNIGNRGEFTAHFIEVFAGSEIAFENILHPDSFLKDIVTGEEIVNKTLINQINLWMGEISPNVNIRTTSISNEYVLLEYVFKQPNFGNTNRFKPENVGFGISFSLPVVVALLSARKGELIIIENPESHIHPRGQAELGKLIAKVAMNDVQIIIETHSDHIINGIRVAIKEQQLNKDKVVLFYFEKIITNNEQYSKVTKIELDKNGTLSEYPENLLDEWSNQMSKLI